MGFMNHKTKGNGYHDLTIHRYQGEGEGFIFFKNGKDLSPTCINRYKYPIHIGMIPPTLDGRV
jgi:hypothetical protein